MGSLGTLAVSVLLGNFLLDKFVKVIISNERNIVSYNAQPVPKLTVDDPSDANQTITKKRRKQM